MAASQSGTFSLQEFSDIGAPLVGGRLYTYVYGTTTHKTAYTDKAGAIPHTYTSDGIGGQYIALNARGELPAPLYLAAGSYDIALKDSTGATIWTRRADPVDDTASAYDAAIRSDLASTSDDSKGASLVSFIQSGESTVWRTVMDKLRERISAHDFGATSTGTTPVDDLTPINAVIAAADTKETVTLGLSRVSLSPAKPGFDTALSAFNAVQWRQGVAVEFKGPTQETCLYSDFVAKDGTPVNEQNFLSPYHSGLVLDVRTPASYGNVAQPTHQRAAIIGSTTMNATSLVFRKDYAGEATIGIRSQVPSTASFTGSISGTTLSVSGVSGTIAIGQTVYTAGAANGVIQGTKITAGAGSTWTVDISQTVTSQAMTSGVDARRLNEFSEVGGTKSARVLDLSTGFQAWGNERSAMVVPHEFGGQIDISTGTHVKPHLSGFNTDPYLRLNSGSTIIAGLKLVTASQMLSFQFESTVADGVSWLQLAKNSGYIDASASYYSPNPGNTILRIGKNGTTGRSINAAGTINASGADYAEYERNNGLAIDKGTIVGFKADGTLTLTYSESVRFGIKSTNPSYVGGDDWFNEDRPGEGATEAEAEAFRQRMDAARAMVDRIAYSGKVPVNVTGATPGSYIVAVAAADGSISSAIVAKSEMTFALYQDVVGRVNRIIDDGRAEVAVIVH